MSSKIATAEQNSNNPEGKTVIDITPSGVPITSDLGAANKVISHTVTVVDDGYNNSNSSVPESIETRIKNTIFRILKLPIKGIEYAKAHVEIVAGKVELVIKTDIENAKLDVEHFLHHDRFTRDAINEEENKREYHFTPPENTAKELKQLAGLTTNLPEDGVIGKEDSINKILDNLETKTKNKN